MARTTDDRANKTKMLDQMLEDIAGDEFDEFADDYGSIKAAGKRYVEEDDMMDLDHLH